jgi:hypothetical protein
MPSLNFTPDPQRLSFVALNPEHQSMLALSLSTFHKHSMALFFDHFLELEFVDLQDKLTVELPNKLRLEFFLSQEKNDFSQLLSFDYAVSEKQLEHLMARAEFFLYRLPEHFKGHFKVMQKSASELQVQDPDGRVWKFQKVC